MGNPRGRAELDRWLSEQGATIATRFSAWLADTLALSAR
jgi:hypothetical protein